MGEMKKADRTPDSGDSRVPVTWRDRGLWARFSHDDDLLDGLTDMPEEEVRALADFFGLPAKKVQGIVWLTEMRCRDAEG